MFVGETDQNMISYKETLANIARSIVDHPDEVTVAETENDDGEITLVLSVAPSDMGKVIGKRGRIAKAIRSVIKAVSNLDGDRVSVEIQ